MYLFQFFRHPISLELLIWTLSAFAGLTFAAMNFFSTIADYRDVKRYGFNGARKVVAVGNLRRETNRIIEQLLFLFIAFEVTFLFPPLPKGFSIKRLPGPTLRGELFSYALILAAGLVGLNTFFDRRDRFKVNEEIRKRG